MEKLALKRLIERAMEDLKIVDLVTDASSVIMALIRTLKGQCLLRTVANAKHFLLMLLSVSVFK